MATQGGSPVRGQHPCDRKFIGADARIGTDGDFKSIHRLLEAIPNVAVIPGPSGAGDGLRCTRVGKLPKKAMTTLMLSKCVTGSPRIMCDVRTSEVRQMRILRRASARFKKFDDCKNAVMLCDHPVRKRIVTAGGGVYR